MNIYALFILLFSFGVLLIAVLTAAKRKDMIAIRFALFSIGVCGWGFFWFFWTNQNITEPTALFLSRLCHLFAVFIPVTWLHFVLDYIGKEQRPKMLLQASYFVTLLLALLTPTSLFINGMHPYLELKQFVSPGPFYHLFTVIFVVLVSFGFYHLLFAYRSAMGQTKEQLKYFILATIIGFIAGGSTLLGVYNIPYPMIIVAAMPVYPFFMGIALIKYGLFDVQQIADAFQREKLAAIGTMAASLNHELRNPLFVAKGKIESHLDAVERGLYSNDQEKIKASDSVLDTAHHHLNRAMDIMQRFSDFAKPFGQKADKINVKIQEVFEQVVPLVSNEFEMKKIKLISAPMDGLAIQANRRQLEEIFFNLIVNACHAMGDKGGELKVTAAQPNGRVLIEISDTGPGIPKENQRRIFEPFYSTKGEKGSGLGLYITKQLVERNGGKISVKSRPGQGAKFILEFSAR